MAEHLPTCGVKFRGCDPDCKFEQELEQSRRATGLSLNRSTQPTVQDVWDWPEFKALAKRLGIDLTLSTSYLGIEFNSPDSPVMVTHRYQGEDKQSSGIGMPNDKFAGIVPIKDGPQLGSDVQVDPNEMKKKIHKKLHPILHLQVAGGVLCGLAKEEIKYWDDGITALADQVSCPECRDIYGTIHLFKPGGENWSNTWCGMSTVNMGQRIYSSVSMTSDLNLIERVTCPRCKAEFKEVDEHRIREGKVAGVVTYHFQTHYSTVRDEVVTQCGLSDEDCVRSSHGLTFQPEQVTCDKCLNNLNDLSRLKSTSPIHHPARTVVQEPDYGKNHPNPTVIHFAKGQSPIAACGIRQDKLLSHESFSGVYEKVNCHKCRSVR